MEIHCELGEILGEMSVWALHVGLAVEVIDSAVARKSSTPWWPRL